VCRQASVRASPSGQELAHATQPLLSVCLPHTLCSFPSPISPNPTRPGRHLRLERSRRGEGGAGGGDGAATGAPQIGRDLPRPQGPTPLPSPLYPRHFVRSSREIRNPARELGVASGRRSRSLGGLWVRAVEGSGRGGFQSLASCCISRGDEMNLFGRNGMLDWQCLEMGEILRQGHGFEWRCAWSALFVHD